MEDIESAGLEHVAPLEADNVPDSNQSHYCFACETPMTGLYCAACGNKNDDMRRSIWSLGGELFASLTAFEGRIWKSLRSLIFKPGEMAREFSDGARTKWTSPIRMYLAMSILLFGYVSLSQTQLVAFGAQKDKSDTVEASFGDIDMKPRVFFLERKSKIRELVSDDDISELEKNFSAMNADLRESSQAELMNSLEYNRRGLANLDAQIANPPSPYAVSGLEAGRKAVQTRVTAIEAEIARREDTDNDITRLEETDEADISLDSPIQNPADQLNLDERLRAESDKETTDTETADTETASEDEGKIVLSDMSGKKVTLEMNDLRQAVSIALRQPERVNAPVNNSLPRIMFIMMPFSMLLGAIFIRGRENAMLYDHLVHAAYIHAFSFLLLFVFILLVQYTSLPQLVLFYTLILLIYLPLSAKRMFNRGWFKTIITSYGVGLVYTFIMGVILLTLIIYGAIDIARDVAEARTNNF